MITKMYWLHALTPLHPGTGEGVGFIDLPVAREMVTAWPTVRGSSIKGVLSEAHQAAKQADRMNSPMLRAAFGVEDGKEAGETGNSGSLVFCDARMVALPAVASPLRKAWAERPIPLPTSGEAGSTIWPGLPAAMPRIVPT